MKKYLHLKILFFAFLCLNTGIVFSQTIKLSEDPDQFITDVKTLTTNSKNEASMKVAAELEGVWGNATMTDNIKKRVIGVAQLMIKKKMKTKDHLVPFFASVAYSIKNKNITVNKLDTMLIVTYYMVDKAKPQKIKTFLETTRLFMETGLLYKSSFNRLRVQGGNYAFGFHKGEEDEEEGEELPPIEENVPLDSLGNPIPQDSVQVAKKKETKKGAIDWFSDWSAPAEEVYQDWGMQSDSGGNALENSYVPAEQPRVTGAYLYLSGCDLEFITKFDSTAIQGTKGNLIFSSRIFVGDGGKFSWAVAGLNDTYVDLKKYNFNIISAKFSAEDVKITSTRYVDGQIPGVFEFKSVKHRANGTVDFPRFMSYHGNVVIKNIDDNIKYIGGFSLDGNKVYSSNVDETPSLIEVFSDGKLKFRSLAKLFKLYDSTIVSDLVKIAIFQKEDSITHQGVSFSYNKNSNILKLVKDKFGYRHTPYIDSYHGIEISCDMLKWNLKSTSIDFDMINAKDQNAAFFESGEYFQHDVFDRLKGLYPFHPLIMAVSFAKEKQTDQYNVEDLIREYKVQAGATKSAFKELVKKGFITYNYNSGEVNIQQKAWHYFKSAKGKKDYDELQVVSLAPDGTNATLNLENNVLTVRGVKTLHLSKALDVYVQPKDKSVQILEDRDMVFTGNVKAGHFLLIGREFRFDYDSFFVDMQNLDSLKLLVDTKDLDEKGHTKVAALKSQIEATSGTLFINKRDNKSNKKDMPQYPLFKSSSGSEVYYNSQNTLGGVYGKRIFFEVPPFTVDSLNSNIANGIKFKGTFHSDGIFPDFPDVITVMEDLSLGFKRKTPKKGFPLYGEKAKYDGEIRIDYSGLRGHGVVQYLSTTIKSEDYVFFPDSVYSVGTSLVTKEGKFNGVYYPDLQIDQHDLKWHVKVDTMIVGNFNNSYINLYNKTVQLDGKAYILKDGTWGDGTLKTRGSQTVSNMVRFKEGEFDAREAFFTIESSDPAKPALRSTHVKLHFDFKTKHAYFSPEIEGFPANDFPFFKYKTSMNDGDWDLDKQIITLKMPKGGNLKNSYFRSYAPDQDSLFFNAEFAEYDIKQMTLNIKGVPEIRVTDSKVFPDKNEVSLKGSTKLNPLLNCKVETDTVTHFHHLHNANIRITSRSEYLGDALYDYYDAGGELMKLKMTNFKFEEFEGKRKNEFHTTAKSGIRAQDTFMLAPKIFFKGDINLKANQKHLNMDGFVRLKLKGFGKQEEWIKYTHFLDKDTIEIGIENLMYDESTPLYTGLFLSDGKYNLYPTFLSRKRHAIDYELFTAKGTMLRLEKGGSRFVVAPDEKIAGKVLAGNIFDYDDSLNIVDYSGKINLFDHAFYGKDFVVDAASTGQGHMDSAKFDFTTSMIITANAPDKAFGVMANDLSDFGTSGGLPTAIGSDSDSLTRLFVTHLANLTTEKDALKYNKQIIAGYKPLHKVVKSLSKNLVITDVKLVWNDKLQSWHSVGDIGIANIYKKDVNFRMKGYIEIKKFSKGDKFHIYLEPSADSWYYMVFEFNRLSMSSSNPDFTDIITKESKGKNDNGKYCFVPADPQEKLVFIKNFTRHYIDPNFEAPKKTAPHDTHKKDTHKTDKEADKNQPHLNTSPTEHQAGSEKKEEPKKEEGK